MLYAPVEQRSLDPPSLRREVEWGQLADKADTPDPPSSTRPATTTTTWKTWYVLSLEDTDMKNLKQQRHALYKQIPTKTTRLDGD